MGIVAELVTNLQRLLIVTVLWIVTHLVIVTVLWIVTHLVIVTHLAIKSYNRTGNEGLGRGTNEPEMNQGRKVAVPRQHTGRLL